MTNTYIFSKLLVSRPKFSSKISLFTGIFQGLSSAFLEHLFFRIPSNGCCCKPRYKYLILFKEFGGSSYRSPKLLKSRDKLCWNSYVTGCLGV